MFNKLRVKNFRSIRDSRDIKLAQLNLIVGPNNCGKSSLLYTLLLLKQTLQDKNPDNTLTTSSQDIDLGSYLDIILSKDLSKNLEIGFEVDKNALTGLQYIDFGTAGRGEPFNRYNFKFLYNEKKNEIYVKSFELSQSKSRIKFAGNLEGSNWEIEGIPTDLKPHLRPEFEHFLPFLLPTGKKPQDETVKRVMDLCLVSRMRLRPLCDFFEDIRYVGPIRQHIPRYGMLGTMPHSDLGPSGQNLMRVLSQKLRRGVSKRTIIGELNYWLDHKFKILKNIRLLDLDKTKKTVKALIADEALGIKSINLSEMGSGISQLVPVVVQTVLTPQKGCLIIEQPEIHLHPAAQASLADLFVHHAVKEKKQIIVETHSEHLLLRVRRRIAEGKLSPEKVCILFVNKGKTGKDKGFTKISSLKLKKDGHFEKWPRGFFEEGYREAMSILEAKFK